MQKKLIQISCHLLISIALAVTSPLVFASSNDDKPFPWFSTLVGIGALVLLILANTGEKEKVNRDLEGGREKINRDLEKAKLAAQFVSDTYDKMQALIINHVSTLAVKNHQLISKDAYGIVDVSGFSKEMDYFIEKVLSADCDVKSYLGGMDAGNFDETMSGLSAQMDAWKLWRLKQPKGSKISQSEIDVAAKLADISKKSVNRTEDAKQLIYKLVHEYRVNQIENQEGREVDVESLDPIQFEHNCADLLKSTGWNPRVTQASGDQGIDVIAQLGNVKAVFQCKKYSQPVGNAAVQEIIAGKAFEQAHVAAVVTNATYTPSAKQLASTTGVHLLHFSEVTQFAEKLGLVESV
jgi:restriction system protein